MTLDQAFEQARTFESAEVRASSYMGSSFPVQSTAMKTEDCSEETVATSATSSSSSRFKNASFVEMTYTHEPFGQLEMLLAENVEKGALPASLQI
ncbi:hypothetical protein TNCV_2119541 [Trichonephila clavipes]|nr:hypothetical protein TNCV_2119541 [Trichonephila clavipes]